MLHKCPRNFLVMVSHLEHNDGQANTYYVFSKTIVSPKCVSKTVTEIEFQEYDVIIGYQLYGVCTS